MMKLEIRIACIVILMTCVVSARKLMHDHMKDAFDDMSYFYKGKGHPFNATFYHELVQCFHKFNDTTLYESQIAGWKGIADYWRSNQINRDYMGRSDLWGQTPPGIKGDKKPYDEYYYRPNVTMGRYHILTYEPCNYESNMAYYHSVLKICNYDNWAINEEMQHNLIQAMATMAIGSSFMHQSYTYVGVRFDNGIVAILAYLAHLSLIQNLPNQTPMLVDLQHNKRSTSVTQFINQITQTIRTKPVPTWADVLDHGDYPQDYFYTFAAFVINTTALVFPSFITYAIISFFMTLILPKRKEWVLQQYLPAIFESTKNNRIPMDKRFTLLIKFYGVLFKLLFAFSFQEHLLPIPGFRSHPVIWVGGFLIPIVNSIADSMTGFHQLDVNVNMSQYLYPGQEKCKHDSGHSIWHEVSANGLLDLIYLCDYMNLLIIQYVK